MFSWLRVKTKQDSKKKKQESKDKLFWRNGFLMLDARISSCNGKSNPIRFFSEDELKRATNDYHQDQFLGRGLYYRLFQGTDDDRLVFVKMFDDQSSIDGIDYLRLQLFVNEVTSVSQTNHKNIAKLLGCCLDIELPVLVYEHASNGTLFDHIHEKEGDRDPLATRRLLSWEKRIRIATEIADAVTYLHIGTSKPIIHRDIKSKNVLLDHSYTAKLFGFTLSASIPSGETHVDDGFVGSIGYVAPECLSTKRLTEKADVFSFGMLLLELLTGRRVCELAPLPNIQDLMSGKSASDFYQVGSDQYGRLRDYLRSIVEDNRVHEIVAPAIMEERGIEEQQLNAFFGLVVRCTGEAAEGRPTMLEVAKELRRI